MRNMNVKRHGMASVLIVKALQKGPCGANLIAYTDVGSADKLSEQGLDLRNTANKTLPSWLIPKLTAHALKASSRPDAILLLPCTACFSRVTTRSTCGWRCCRDAPSQLPPATTKNPPSYISLLFLCFCSDGSNQNKIWASGGKSVFIWEAGWEEPFGNNSIFSCFRNLEILYGHPFVAAYIHGGNA